MPEKLEELTAILLAGGQSKRMGRDKAFLEWKGKTLVERLVKELKTCTDSVMVVTKRKESFSSLEASLFEDAYPVFTPLAGIVTGLEQSRTDLNFIVACDLPLLSRALIRRLYRAMKKFGADADALLPRSPDGLEPLCAIYHRRCLLPLRRALLRKRSLGVLDAVKDLKVKIVETSGWPEKERRVFTNVNTPRDYKRLCGLITMKR